MTATVRDHRLPRGVVPVRLARHHDVWGMLSPSFAARVPERIIRCSRCDRPAVQVDPDWPWRNDGTLCRAHLED